MQSKPTVIGICHFHQFVHAKMIQNEGNPTQNPLLSVKASKYSYLQFGKLLFQGAQQFQTHRKIILMLVSPDNQFYPPFNHERLVKSPKKNPCESTMLLFRKSHQATILSHSNHQNPSFSPVKIIKIHHFPGKNHQNP